MSELIKLFQAIHVLSPALIEYLYQVLQPLQLSKKQYLLKAGQVNQHVYFVTEGLLRSFYKEEINDTTSWFMKKGDIFVSVQSFYKQEKSYEYIQALEKCELISLHIRDINFIYNNFPEFNFIGRVITEKYNLILSEYYYLSKVKSATDRYAYFINNYGDLARQISSKDIASFLNISEPHLSSIKTKLHHSGK